MPIMLRNGFKIHDRHRCATLPVIPGRKNRKVAIEYDEERYKRRGLIERIFGKLKENHRLVVRYEKSDANFLGFVLFAFLKILLC